MSEISQLKIALVAEGVTDHVIIEAALKAILPVPFVLTSIQPEETRPEMGQGWCGVLNWCLVMGKRFAENKNLNPELTLTDFLDCDWLILHIDVDVADKEYSHCGTRTQKKCIASNCQDLPCIKPCPPVADTVTALQQVLESWLEPATLDTKTVLCLPAQSSGTWLAAAILPDNHELFNQMECNATLEDNLPRLPKKERIRKNMREYQTHATEIKNKWEQVKEHCSQAQVFEEAILKLNI